MNATPEANIEEYIGLTGISRELHEPYPKVQFAFTLGMLPPDARSYGKPLYNRARLEEIRTILARPQIEVYA